MLGASPGFVRSWSLDDEIIDELNPLFREITVRARGRRDNIKDRIARGEIKHMNDEEKYIGWRNSIDPKTGRRMTKPQYSNSIGRVDSAVHASILRLRRDNPDILFEEDRYGILPESFGELTPEGEFARPTAFVTHSKHRQ